MAKTYTPGDLARRAFVITMVGVLAWIAAAFAFVILAE
jgi:hypothetical protein